MNFDFGILYESVFHQTIHVKHAWTGEFEAEVLQLSIFYFLVDLFWVVLIPGCVRSPNTIIVHHLAVCVYIYLVVIHPDQFWFMGSCLSIEINTWFLIARRVMNQAGLPVWNLNLPWGFSLQVKIISLLFYSTWFLGRCILFPFLWTVVFKEWMDTKEEGILLKLLMHSVFTILNLKWTYALVISKINYMKKYSQDGNDSMVGKSL